MTTARNSGPSESNLPATERAERNRQKARDWRAKMRAKGLRPVQLWVPDTRSDAFRAEARRQMELLARSPHAEEDQAWVDAVSISPDDWT